MSIKIVIAGAGYVGLSNGILLAQYNGMVCLDVMVNQMDSELQDVADKVYISDLFGKN